MQTKWELKDLGEKKHTDLQNEAVEVLDKVTVGVVTFNRKDAVMQTLQAIDGLDYPDYEVMVVDNHSTDGSVEWMQQHFPHFRIIALEENNGPNAARNTILREAKSDFVLLMDNDIILEADALEKLVRVMKNVPRAALCHPEIVDPIKPESAHHYNGGWIHYLGALMPRKYSGEARPEYETFDVLSGQALLADRQAALEIGGFDDYYFFGWDDGDFTARLSLAGYLCLNVPDAVGVHNNKPRESAQVFYQVRNRWYFMLKTYSWRTLILSAPAFFVYELSLLALVTLTGSIKDYLRGNLAVLRDLPLILKERGATQKFKTRRDNQWLRAGELYLPATVDKHKLIRPLLRIYNGFFNVYWALIKSFLTLAIVSIFLG